MTLTDIKCFSCGGGMVIEDHLFEESGGTLWLACRWKTTPKCLDHSLKVYFDLTVVRGNFIPGRKTNPSPSTTNSNPAGENLTEEEDHHGPL